MNLEEFGMGLLLAAALFTTAHSQTPATAVHSEESGLAAVYSDKLTGHMTASGKKYDPTKLTAAHNTLPFGTTVKVTNTQNGKSVELRITDRGPKQNNRILDITPRAAHALGIHKMGMAEVKFTVVEDAHTG